MQAVTEKRSWREWGEYFGFPECCIAQFEKDCCAETKREDPQGAWHGTGYVPCMACARKAKGRFSEFVEENILPHRKCAEPFGPGAF